MAFNDLSREQMEAQLLRQAQKIGDLRVAAETFRAAVIESGALNHVSQDKYINQLRALETALA